MDKMQTARVYRSTWEQLQRLKSDPELYMECVESYFRYAFDGIDEESSNLVVAVFMDSSKPLCDNYKKSVTAHREVGKKGGRPKKASYDSEKFKEKAHGIIEYKPKETKENQKEANEN